MRHGSAAAAFAPRRRRRAPCGCRFRPCAKLKGRAPVGERTELLASYHEVFLDLFGRPLPAAGRGVRKAGRAAERAARRRCRSTGARGTHRPGEYGPGAPVASA